MDRTIITIDRYISIWSHEIKKRSKNKNFTKRWGPEVELIMTRVKHPLISIRLRSTYLKYGKYNVRIHGIVYL